MPRTNAFLDDRLEAIKKVAVLCSQGALQHEIAKLFDISQPLASQLIAAARDHGWLCERHPEYTGPDRERIERSLSCLQSLGSQLVCLAEKERWPIRPSLHLAYAGLRTTGPDWDASVVSWGKAVAPLCFSLLQSCKQRVGICWGRQIRSMVDGLIGLRRSLKGKRSIDVVPLWGQRLKVHRQEDDQVFTDHRLLSSNALASDLSDVLHGQLNCPAKKKRPTWYLPVPDFIPIIPEYGEFEDVTMADLRKEAEEEHLKEVLKAFREIEDYRAIFGRTREDTDALAMNLDAIVASVGPSGVARTWARPNESYGGVPPDWLKKWTIGDLGGVLIPREEPQRPLKVVQQFSRLANHWTGVQLDHLQCCARHANGKSRPGTIVLAVGPERGPIVLGCLRMGLINVLLADFSLADELLKLVNQALKSNGSRPNS